MTRTANILYSLAFILVVTGLALGSLPAALSFSSSSETSVIDGKLSSTFEKHYDKGFVLKDFGTNAWAALEYCLFGEGRPGVVIGSNDWLFTAEEFDPPGDSKLAADNWQLIRGVEAELKKRGIDLVVLLLPAKARLYPENLAEQKPVTLQQELYEVALKQMQQLGLEGPQLLQPLREGKHQREVFLRTDTHWTPFGAAVVATATADYLRAHRQWSNGDLDYQTQVLGTESHKGDLLSYLPLDPYFEGLQPAAERLEKRQTEQVEEGADLFGSSAPEVALVGTSYSANPKWNFQGALREALHADLYNYAEDGHGPLVPMLRLLAKGEEETKGLRLVLWEVPERYLVQPSDLSEFDSKWLAQLRHSSVEPQQLAVKSVGRPLAAH